MNRKFLIHRTIAPHLSELFNEIYDSLTTVHPGVKNFAILLHDCGDNIQTRILPLTEKAMKDMADATEGKVKYVAYTDEESNFIKGEEK